MTNPSSSVNFNVERLIEDNFPQTETDIITKLEYHREQIRQLEGKLQLWKSLFAVVIEYKNTFGA